MAQAWVPVFAKPVVLEALQRAARTGSSACCGPGGAPLAAVMQPLATDGEPPTLFQTDEFSAGARPARRLQTGINFFTHL